MLRPPHAATLLVIGGVESNPGQPSAEEVSLVKDPSRLQFGAGPALVVLEHYGANFVSFRSVHAISRAGYTLLR